MRLGSEFELLCAQAAGWELRGAGGEPWEAATGWTGGSDADADAMPVHAEELRGTGGEAV